MPAAARLMTAHQLGTSLRGSEGRWSVPALLSVSPSTRRCRTVRRDSGKGKELRRVCSLRRRAGTSGRGFALSSGPWWLHAVAVAEKPSTVIVIGVIVVCTFITKTIQVIYAQRAKIIGAKAKRDVKTFRAQREPASRRDLAVVHIVCFCSAETQPWFRAEVLNPDLPEGRRLSDVAIFSKLSCRTRLSEIAEVIRETFDTSSASCPSNRATEWRLAPDRGARKKSQSCRALIATDPRKRR